MARWHALILVAALAGCGDECTKYSDYNCRQLAKADYNVYVYLHGDERYAGVATGLDDCADLADEFSSRDDDRGDWNYVCCLKTDESSCAEKHR